jgi:hypothetical protein
MDVALDEAGASETSSTAIGFSVGRQLAFDCDDATVSDAEVSELVRHSIGEAHVANNEIHLLVSQCADRKTAEIFTLLAENRQARYPAAFGVYNSASILRSKLSCRSGAQLESNGRPC